MRYLSAIIAGLMSAFLISMILALLGLDPSVIAVAILILALLGSTSALLYKCTSVSKVWARAGLMGAAEWIVMIGASWIAAGRAVTGTTAGIDDTAVRAGAAIGGGIVGAFGSGFSLFMALVCLVIWFIGNKANAEFKKEDSREKVECPRCAELIFQGAKVCRFCSHQIETKIAV